jgi:beta-lactamase regulating signal transducer with metallopeptidase domain
MGEVLIDTLVNANILFCAAFALWFLFRSFMARIGLNYAHGIQLRLLNAFFLAIVLAPFLSLVYRGLQRSGIAAGMNVNLSDMVVSYYLNGGLEMKASDFEGLILLRDTLTFDILSGAGLLAQSVIAAFLAGLALGLIRLAYSIVSLWRIVDNSFSLRSLGRVRIRVSERTPVPFSTRGLRNYYVVIPSHMLEHPHELKVTFAHEFQHIRQGDLEWEILLESLKPFFFLNPAYHAWKRQVEELREFNCDSEVLSHGRIDARAYCETLLSVSQKSLRRDTAFVVAVPKVTLVTADRSSSGDGGPTFLEHRIRSVLSSRKLVHQKLLFVALALPLISAVVFTSLAIQRPKDWSHDRLMLSTVVNLERLDEINRRSTSGLVRN